MEFAAIVFPVRFVSGGQATQSTSRELGREEISVRCLQPPLVGERVSMALYLPGSARPEVVVGEVSESSPEAGRPIDAGFRARFLALNPEGRHRIAALLEGLAGLAAPPRSEPDESDEAFAGKGDERRALPAPRLFPRYPIRF